jgi:hypothetical protein
MNRYTVLCDLNEKIIMGQIVSENERKDAVSIFLDGIDSTEDVLKYKKRMRADETTRYMYPDFFVPPYNDNKKMRLIQGYLPKTNILYSNHFELEIIRLLAIHDKDNPKVKQIIEKTSERLIITCFGNSCTQGECLATGISVLRFLACAKREHTNWIDQILNPLGDNFLLFGNGQAATQRGIPMSYFLLALTDINNEKARELISKKKDWLLELLRRGWITGKLSNGKISEGDTYNLLGKYIIRNALGILPEFSDIDKHKIYVSEIDDRCYCEI